MERVYTGRLCLGSASRGRPRQCPPRAWWVLVCGFVLLLPAALRAQIVKINFQPPTAAVPVGYLKDTGEAFGDRGNGYYYGWNAPTYETKEGDLYSDPRRNTLNQLQGASNPSAVWEIALENGTYDLHLACGDPTSTSQFNTVNVEGTVISDPDGADNFDEYDLTVTITDGRLTIKAAPAAYKAKVCFIDITRQGYTNAPPWADAGPDQSITWPGEKTVQLAGAVFDDDPDQLGILTVQWSKVSGPGDVVFAPGDNLRQVSARVNAPGVYELKLQAWDELSQSGSDTLKINVKEAALAGDVDGDRDVDLADMALMATRWLGGGENTADVDGSGQVDMGDFCLLARNIGLKLSSVRINEFMATNSYAPPVSNLDISTRIDNKNPFNPDVHPDWIELFNNADEPVNLEGWSLTDDPDVPAKWSFPAGATIAAGGYLIVFASNKEQADYPTNYPFVDYYGAPHTNFELTPAGEYLALVDPRGRIAHACDPYPRQYGLVSYGIGPDGKEGYLRTPTPGTQANNRWTGAGNSECFAGVVGDTHFSHRRGFYDSSIQVRISCDTPAAVIRYTTDGTRPTLSNGRTYTAPVSIASTTCLRAAAFKAGWLESNVDTQTYIFLAQVIEQTGEGFPGGWGHAGADYEMDPQVVGPYAATIKDDLLAVPTISLVMPLDDWFYPSTMPNVGGIYANPMRDDDPGYGWERHVSVEYIDPSNGDDFQLDAGVKIQGGSSTDGWKSDKLSMRLKFNGGYGASSLDYPLFGQGATDSFKTLILDARLNLAWNYGPNDAQRSRAQYTRDQFVSDIENAMGAFGPRGRHVHLYLNGLYWGLYCLHERPDEHFAESLFGGDAYDYDALKHNASTVVNGSNADYNVMFNLARQGLADNARYEAVQQHLDLPEFVDYMITNFYVGNNDWAHQNWYATRNRRDPAGRWRYHSWDAEHVLEGISDNATTRNNPGGPTELHQLLTANAEYRLLFADHVHKHFFNNGILTVEGATAMYQNRLDEVDRAVVGESARWGDNREDQGGITYTRDVHWIAERDWLLGSYFPQRTQIVLNQLLAAGLYPAVAAPSFSRHGGYVPSGFALTMSAPAGTIYYTLDGSDPRTSFDPLPETQMTLIAENAPKRVLVPMQDIGTTWRGGNEPFNDAAWTHGTPITAGRTGGVGFDTGSTMLPYVSYNVQSQMYNKNATCYIRIPFAVSASDLSTLNFMRLRMRYDDGFVAFLNGQEITRANMTNTLTWQARASAAQSNDLAVLFENFDVSLHLDKLQAGENIMAIHGLNRRNYDTDMLISVELITGHNKSAGGVSPTATIYTGPVTLSASATVKVRALSGQWSALNEAVFAVGSVAENLRITEIMYHPQGAPAGSGFTDEDYEYIELKNIGAETINLADVRFANGVDFVFGSVALGAGQHALVVKNEAAFRSRYPAFGGLIAGAYAGSLDNNGERIALLDALGAVIHDFKYSDGWFEVTDGGGFSLTVRDQAAADLTLWDRREGWRPSAAVNGSPGADDSGQVPPLGAIVINEVMAHSHATAPDWIELHNTTDAPIPVGGWFLSDSADDFQKYEIPAETVIPENGYVVFYENLNFGKVGAPGCNTPFALSENGDVVYLHSGENGVLTGYNDEESFGASQTGVSLGRYQKSTGTFNFVAMSEPTPGEDNAYPKVGPVVISEIMYNPVGNSDAEYVELLNITSTNVTLFDSTTNEPWRFADEGGIELYMPVAPVVTLAPGGRLLLVKDLTAFQSVFGAPPVQTVQWGGGGSLSNGGEQIQLSMPGDVDELMERQYIRVDRVVYSDGSHPVGDDPWPAEADGLGKALVRKVASNYGNDVANWQAANPTPGR